VKKTFYIYMISQ